jgi:hypothetical protein
MAQVPEKSDSELFQNVGKSLNQFSKTVGTARKEFSELTSEVLHVPLNDGGRMLKLTMFGRMYDDDFASHLRHLTKMCSTLEDADSNPVTLRKLKENIGESLFEGERSLTQIQHIHDEVVPESIKQIRDLKEVASGFKKLKEEQKSVFREGLEKGNEGAKTDLMSKLKALVAYEAYKAFFDSDLETDPDILLTHLTENENSLDEVCKITCVYVKDLQKVIAKMTEIQNETKEGIIMTHLSDIKAGLKELHQECEKISSQLEEK